VLTTTEHRIAAICAAGSEEREIALQAAKVRTTRGGRHAACERASG
jgi:hypothetical protein